MSDPSGDSGSVKPQLKSTTSTAGRSPRVSRPPNDARSYVSWVWLSYWPSNLISLDPPLAEPVLCYARGCRLGPDMRPWPLRLERRGGADDRGVVQPAPD